MVLLEKPITPEEFDDLHLYRAKGRANRLIKHLNEVLERGSTNTSWGAGLEEKDMFNIVNQCFKKAGWAGVTQKMKGSLNIITVKRRKENETPY